MANAGPEGGLSSSSGQLEESGIYSRIKSPFEDNPLVKYEYQTEKAPETPFLHRRTQANFMQRKISTLTLCQQVDKRERKMSGRNEELASLYN